MDLYNILCFYNDSSQRFILLPNLKELHAKEVELQQDEALDYYEVHLVNSIKCWSKEIESKEANTQ